MAGSHRDQKPVVSEYKPTSQTTAGSVAQVLAVCEAAMHEYGVPTRSRTDNDGSLGDVS
jgi:hypothetical protein